MDNQINRVLLVFKQWEERQKQIEQAMPPDGAREKAIRLLQLAHLMQARNRLVAVLRPDEKPFLVLLNGQIGKLQKLVYPNLLQRLYFQCKDRLFDQPRQLQRLEREKSENLAGIQEQLRSIGFTGFAGSLEKHLKEDLPKASIRLEAQLDQKRSFQVTLHFERDQSERFVFNRIDAAITHQDSRQINQLYEFKLDEWPGLQVQHIRNLLEGRAIRQYFRDVTGQMNNRWLELDLSNSTSKERPIRQYLDSYGYNAESEIERLLPKDSDRRGLIQDLENGNRISLNTFAGTDRKPLFAEADPSHKCLRGFDASGQRLSAEQLKDRLNLLLQEKPLVIKKQLQENQNTVRKKRPKISLN